MTLTLNGIHNASVIRNGLMLILSLLWQLKHLQLGYTVPIVTIKCNNQGIGQGLILRCFIEEGNYCLRMIAITNCWAWNHAREAQKLTSRLFSAFFSMQNCSRVVCQPVVGTLNMNCSYVLSFALRWQIYGHSFLNKTSSISVIFVTLTWKIHFLRSYCIFVVWSFMRLRNPDPKFAKIRVNSSTT